MKKKCYKSFSDIPLDSAISLEEVGRRMETFYNFLIENDVKIETKSSPLTSDKYKPKDAELISVLMNLEKSFILGQNIGLPNVDDIRLITSVVKKVKSSHIDPDKILNRLLIVFQIISALSNNNVKVYNPIYIENNVTYNIENNVTYSTKEAVESFESILTDLNISKDDLITLSYETNLNICDLPDVAERIKKIVALRGTSVSAMLKDCNLGKNTIDKMSNGSDIFVSNLAKIADYLDVSVDYLLGRTDNKAINPLSAEFFRILLSDRGINAIKPALKKRIDAYGYENLERDTGLSLMEIKLFLTTDIESGTKGIAKLYLLLGVLETNVYDLLNESVDEKYVKYDIDTSGEIAAYKGKETRAMQPKINREITLPQK